MIFFNLKNNYTKVIWSYTTLSTTKTVFNKTLYLKLYLKFQLFIIKVNIFIYKRLLSMRASFNSLICLSRKSVFIFSVKLCPVSSIFSFQHLFFLIRIMFQIILHFQQNIISFLIAVCFNHSFLFLYNILLFSFNWTDFWNSFCALILFL